MTHSERSDSEYRVRLMVEVVLCPDDRETTRRDPDTRAVRDACNVKGYLEDPEIQTRIDEAGSRGRIIGAWVHDVRRVEFTEPVDVDAILARDLKRRIEELDR